MTPNEAADLADTLTRAWPQRGVAADIWAAILEPLDHHQAAATMSHLLGSFDHAPAVSAFKAAYRGQTPTHRPIREDCARCAGTGWEQITVQRTGYPVESTGVAPCKCSNGKANDDAHRRAIEHNDLELRRGTKPHASGVAA